jgi:hypothetical protein
MVLAISISFCWSSVVSLMMARTAEIVSSAISPYDCTYVALPSREFGVEVVISLLLDENATPKIID